MDAKDGLILDGLEERYVEMKRTALKASCDASWSALICANLRQKVLTPLVS